MRTKALKESKSFLNAAIAIQLCCDERVVLSMDYYIFLGQYTDGYDQKHESVIVSQKHTR